jgi:hypothetical protein
LMPSIEGMVTPVFHGPHGQQAEPVVRFGTNRSGTRRLWCNVGRQAFTPQPRDRRVTPAQEASLAAALTARLSPRAVARRLKVSRDTLRRTRKQKRQAPGSAISSCPPFGATRWRATRWWCTARCGGAPAPSGSRSHA